MNLKKEEFDWTWECFFWCRKHLELGRYRMEEVTGGDRREREREGEKRQRSTGTNGVETQNRRESFSYISAVD